MKTLTDETGHYLFDHLLLDEQDGDSNATRYVIAPLLSAPYRPSPADQGTDDAADSDSQDGVVADVTRGECAEHYDFGTYMGGVVEGFVFRDDNGDLLRTAGDSSVTNIPVRLVGPDAFGATTNTDAHGYFRFEWVPPSSVSVLVSRVDAALAAVPAEEPDASDARRNRALPDDGGEDAFIAHSVTSGTGVLADRPSSTLNFGFVSYPLSTAVGLSLHAAADGVMIELWTENESGDGDIVIGAWIDNAWTEIGRIPAGQLAGEGSNRYTVRAHGLSADGAYLIRIVDESGHVHHSSEPVPVRALVAQAVRLEMDTLAVRFNTERGRRYCVWVSTDLVTWAPEYVSAPTAGGWSAFSVSPFTAGGLLTEVRVPLNGRKKAFFRVVMTD